MRSGPRWPSPLSQPTSKRSLTWALPKLPDGRTYVTEQMMKEEPALRRFVHRTRGAWHHDFEMSMYITGALELRIPPTRRQSNDVQRDGPAQEESIGDDQG
jgi:hypothetical protein